MTRGIFKDVLKSIGIRTFRQNIRNEVFCKPNFFGVIKNKSSDFKVSEINCEGEEKYLYENQKYFSKRKQRKEEEDRNNTNEKGKGEKY